MATASVSADDPLAARRTPTPSDTPQPTATTPPTISSALTPTPDVSAPAPATATPAAHTGELTKLYDDMDKMAVNRYPDGSISFWRAHPERGDWGFMGWLDTSALPGAQDTELLRQTDDRNWTLTVRRIDECGGPSWPIPADPAELHYYAARVVARMTCDRPTFYFWLVNERGERVSEGGFSP